MMEVLVCYFFDIIKVCMQFFKCGRVLGQVKCGFICIGVEIVQKEIVFGLYKGFGVVFIGIVFKMVICFILFEWYKQFFVNKEIGVVFGQVFFFVGFFVGVIEVVVVVIFMEVIKICFQV